MKTVLRLTGLTAETLRAWERRYQAVTPERSPSGRRVYRSSEVQRLQLLVKLVKSGRSISTIAHLSDDQLIAQTSDRRNFFPDSSQEFEAEVAQLLDYARSADMDSFSIKLRDIHFTMSPKIFVFNLVPQLMVQVGKHYEQGGLSVSQEHAISDRVGWFLFRIYEGLGFNVDAVNDEKALDKKTKRGTIVFASPEGESHVFGLLVAAILARLKGFYTVFLGPNIPLDQLCEVSEQAMAMGIALSVTESEAMSPDRLNRVIAELDERIPKNCDLWVGGTASHHIKRSGIRKNIWIFETLDQFESRLNALP